ncbi:hypothetical protein DFQ26_000195 [Actinomortierella ambigua]|nr:hypothetical protein DFQ26_000195 [Actinomortierella ambigua]
MESILEQPSQPLPASRRLDASSFHLLPCGIKHEGKANVSDFFIVTNPVASSQVESDVTITTTTTASTTTQSGGLVTATVTTCTSTKETMATTAPLVPETSFRGRALKGTVVQMPPSYVGSIYTLAPPPPPAPIKQTKATKSNKDAMDMDQDEYDAMLQGFNEERKTWTTTAQFDSFMLWGHDHAPTVRTDKVMKAMEWVNIADILHQSMV